MLRLEQATLAIGGRDLLREVDWHLRPGDKVGVVGRNGTGKTSMLRALVGELDLESGEITRRGGIQLGYLRQHARLESDRPVWEEARAGMTRLNGLAERVAAAQAAAERGEDGAPEQLSEATEHFRVAGGYRIDETIGEVLSGLGFGPENWSRPCATFSGGWQVRIALARLLLSEPDVLLLDEPTNHLDLLARGWLARWLSASERAAVLVSHDRHLLDVVCRRMVEVRGRKLHTFKGNFTAWESERTLRAAQELDAFGTQQDEIAKLERFVTRFKAKATKAAQARSRQKQLDKIERISAPTKESGPRLQLPPAPPCSEEALVLEGAVVGFGDDPPVLDGVNLTLCRGMRVAVLGANGGGKSTLLGALAGTLPMRSGRRRVGRGVRFGHFHQDLSRSLPVDERAIDVVSQTAPAAGETRCRGALGALGLRGDAALREVGVLSGGEKARVVLAGFALRPANLLLLDEPTNHLDVVTVGVLIEALRAHEGLMVFVTHDRYLVEALATHVVHVGDGGLSLTAGVCAEDFELKGPTRLAPKTAPVAAVAHADRKRAQRERQRLQRRFDAMGASIEAAETELERIDGELSTVGSDGAAIATLAKARSVQERSIEALYEEWAELETALSD